MEDWLKIPERNRFVPIWRLCALMGVMFLTLWIGSPLLFAFVFGSIDASY
jgi:hypothetical protein